jgi:hypothetical protein
MSLDSAAGERLFEDILERFVRPELARRLDAGEIAQDTFVYRFQVLLHHDRPVEVRLNRDVRGSAIVEKVTERAFEVGDEVTVEDVAGIASFEPHPEDVGIPHLTGIMHRDGWSLAFEFRSGHPKRHDFLQRGRDFLEAARDAAAADRLGVFVDNGLSACELLAKAELLASQPTVEIVLDKTSHKTIKTTYHAWARLGNTEQRFLQLLERLHELRSAGRYVDRDLVLDPWSVVAILSALDDMLEHVAAAVAGDQGDTSSGDATQTYIATRALNAGGLVTNDDVKIFPPSLKT